MWKLSVNRNFCIDSFYSEKTCIVKMANQPIRAINVFFLYSSRWKLFKKLYFYFYHIKSQRDTKFPNKISFWQKTKKIQFFVHFLFSNLTLNGILIFHLSTSPQFFIWKKFAKRNSRFFLPSFFLFKHFSGDLFPPQNCVCFNQVSPWIFCQFGLLSGFKTNFSEIFVQEKLSSIFFLFLFLFFALEEKRKAVSDVRWLMFKCQKWIEKIDQLMKFGVKKWKREKTK